MAGESPVGHDHARTRDIVLVMAGVLLATSLLLYLLVTVWPPAASATAGPRPATKTPVRLFGRSVRLSLDVRLFIVVVVAGAIGSLVHVLRSLYWYVGNRSLRRSWLAMYISLPFVGAMLGLVVYLVVRGGLTTSLAQPSDINPYGVAGVSALVGMFSRETSEKLRTVFATLLAPAQAGRDQAFPPRIVSMFPRDGEPGTVVTFHGSGLATASTVAFGPAETPAEIISDNEVRAVVPTGAVPGRPVVNTPSGPMTSPVAFIVIVH